MILCSKTNIKEENFRIKTVDASKLYTGTIKDFLPFNLLKFRFAVSKGKFDIINLHHSTLFLGLIGMKNIIVTYHGSPPAYGKTKCFRNFVNILGKISLRYAKYVITISEYLKNELIKFKVPEEKIKVIPNCVSEEFYPTWEDEEYMLYVGRLEKHKRVEQVIKLAKEINFRLKIVGDGPERKNLEEFAEKINAPVEFLGRVDRNKLIELYQKCSFFVSASEWEGFGLIFLEANACGKPVIGYDLTAISERIINGYNGFKVSTYTELVKAAQKLKKDKKLQKKGEMGITYRKNINGKGCVMNMKNYSKNGYPEAALIILSWNAKETTRNCLESLLKNTNYPNYRVVVVDNGSTDGTVEMIKKKFGKKVDLIANRKNLGFPKGMNKGIKYVLKKYNPKYIGLLNNDLLFPDKLWLMKIIRVMEKDESIAIASPMFIFPNGNIQRIGEKLGRNLVSIMIKVLTALPERKYTKKPKGIKEVDVFLGACVIVKTKILKEVGLLDERYSPFLVEDVEYSFRIKKYGYKIVTVCDSRVIHLLSFSMKKMTKENIEKDLFKVYVVTRNAFLFSLEYFGFIKSFLISLPIIVFATFFERKKKNYGLSLSNLKLRKKIKRRLSYLLRALIDALRLREK